MKAFVAWLTLATLANASPVWVSEFTNPLPNQVLNGPRWAMTRYSHEENYYYWDLWLSPVGAWWQIFGDWDPNTKEAYPGGDITVVTTATDEPPIVDPFPDGSVVKTTQTRSTVYHNGKPLEPLVDMNGLVEEVLTSKSTEEHDHDFYIYWGRGEIIGNRIAKGEDRKRLILHETPGYYPEGMPTDVFIDPSDPDEWNIGYDPLYFENVTFTYYPDGLPSVPEPSGIALITSGLVGLAVAQSRRRHRASRKGLSGY